MGGEKGERRDRATERYGKTKHMHRFSTRGSYRTNVEDMDPNLRPPQNFQPPPGAPPTLTPMGVMHAIPIGPNLGPPHGPNLGPPHGHPLQQNPMPMGHNFPPPPYVMPNPPMGMVMNMGPPQVNSLSSSFLSSLSLSLSLKC